VTDVGGIWKRGKESKRKGCSGKWRKISRKLKGYAKKNFKNYIKPLKKT